MRYRQPLTIPLRLARGAGALDRQIADGIAGAVRQGLLLPGTRMPSTRTLAAALRVSRGVAAAAYEELGASGHLVGRPGSGTYVSGTDPAPPPTPGPRSTVDMTPGAAAGAAFPLAAWRAAWRVAGLHQPPADPPPPLGAPDLRDAIAAHLVRTRGLCLDGYQVVVTDGNARALGTVLAATVPGGEPVAVDDPAPPWLHRVVAGHARPVPSPAGAGCAAMVVTPDGAVPHGGVLSAARRAAALRWATRTGGCLISIGQEVTFPGDATLAPLLSGGGHAATVLLGDFTDLLTPALRIGYAVLPTGLAGDYGRLVDGHAGQPSWMDQRALAHLLRTGTAERAMHRAGHTRTRHERHLRTHLAGCGTLHPAAAGSALLYPNGWVPERVAADAAAHGVLAPRLAGYHWHRRDAPDALVLGYGHLTEASLRRALTVLAGVILRAGERRPQPSHNPAALHRTVRGRPAPYIDVR